MIFNYIATLWPKVHLHFKLAKRSKQFDRSQIGGGLSGYVKSKPLGNGQIISIDFEMAGRGGQFNFL